MSDKEHVNIPSYATGGIYTGPKGVIGDGGSSFNEIPVPGMKINPKPPGIEPPMQFASPAEAYTHILIQYNKMKNRLNYMETQVNFLLMNIERGNFNSDFPPAHSHALHELMYLASVSNELSTQSATMWHLALQLHEQLRPKGEEE